MASGGPAKGRLKRLVVAAAVAGNLVIAAVLYVVTGGESVAEVWYSVDANSLVGLQALVEKRLDPNPEEPTLYFDVVLPVIETPLWLAALVAMLVLDLVPLALLLRRGSAGPAAVEGS